ncbi:MAG: 4-hydroxy-tetrahydrodipicolinate reductase [Planctomycetes bacterium]|nr:4-hydroxy-tetrahydrodipicolinate reductase [Planctomycetota bacterium]MCB9903996.1 4-hydroxy-tetrahydrodipicolinate reductase [Planctomycetota bacterium]
MSAIGVAVVGSAGRLGSLACEWIAAADDLELVARVEASADLVTELRRTAPAVAVDLTRAPLGLPHGRAMLECGVRPVIGTSGVDAAQTAQLDHLARAAGLGGIVVPNFSLGVWLMQQAAELAARHMPRFEIVEMHHERKLDAPSGTAVHSAERLAEVAGLDPSDVRIHSLRLPGAASNQEIVFGAEGEWLRLRHETYGLACFAPGLLASIRYADRAEGVARGLGAVLGGP